MAVLRRDSVGPRTTRAPGLCGQQGDVGIQCLRGAWPGLSSLPFGKLLPFDVSLQLKLTFCKRGKEGRWERGGERWGEWSGIVCVAHAVLRRYRSVTEGSSLAYLL